MHLYLSKHSPLDSSFSTQDGQVLFKVDTEPIKLGTRSCKISCIIPNDNVDDGRDRFGSLAQIEFNNVESSIIRFRGDRIVTKEYFRKEGWGPYGRCVSVEWVGANTANTHLGHRGRHRMFTGPDGREYKWLLRTWAVKVSSRDSHRIGH